MSTGPSPPAASPTPPQQAPAAFKPNYDILASLNSSRPPSQSSTPAPGPSPQVRQTATPPQAADPFASLMSASPRPTSGAFQPPVQAQSTGSSLLDLAGGTTSPPQAPAPAAEDDEWNFASSLPTSNTLPTKNQVQVLNTQLRVDFLVQRVPAYPRQIFIKAIFSNPTKQAIGDLHFQVAVEKVSRFVFHICDHNMSLTKYSLGIHSPSQAAVRPRHCSPAATGCGTGDGVGRNRLG